ncbi:MAG: UvrB/UvrC motif-containing protein [Anaerolineae bacterium]
MTRLEMEMVRLARDDEYEKAASLRDRIDELRLALSQAGRGAGRGGKGGWRGRRA